MEQTPTPQKPLNHADLSAFYDQHMQDVVIPNKNKGIGNEAVCETAGSTAAKTVAAPDGFSLSVSATVIVTFQNAITVAGATLAVGDAAAKPIFYRGAALAANMVKAGAQLILRYDGTNFNVIGDLDTDTDTVTDVTFDSSDNKLKQTKGGVQTDIVQLVTSGFAISNDETTGLDEISAIGSATITEDDTNGIDELSF